MLHGLLKSVSLVPLLLLLTTAASAPTRLVIGNYTPECASYGSTVPGYTRDIQDAQAAGVDGFEIDMMGWGSEAVWFDHAQAVANMFQAAHNLGTGFKFYFMIDCYRFGSTCQTVAGQMMKQYANDPNYLYYHGKPVLGAFQDNYNSTAGSADEIFWYGVVAAVKAQGIRPFFIPSFMDNTKIISPPNLETQTTNDSGWYQNSVKANSDGIAVWGEDVTPVLNANQDAFGSVMKANNKTLMASVVPFFSQLRFLPLTNQGGVDTMEMHGGEGTAEQWQDIILNLRPPMVRLQTWNDYTESYLSPVSTANLVANDTPIWEMPNDMLWSHAAFTELNKYFIQWYKTGVQPTWPDTMYVFYRSAPMSATTTSPPTGTTVNWTPDGIEPTLDDLYITTILKAPATLTVTSGHATTVLYPSTGMTHFRVPFKSGTQKFTLDRGSAPFISITGDPIATTQTKYYNVNPRTYYAYSQ
jgi:glucan endo-1,3-alpha-glucosidase